MAKKNGLTYTQKFQNRFIQQAKKALRNLDIEKEITKIRTMWGIPADGFSNISNLDQWLKKQKADNYQHLNKDIKTLKTIKAKPKSFLDILYFYRTESEDKWPDTLYFLGNEKTFYELISEKPFPGIVHYILMNKIFIPESNELQVTLNKDDYPVLHLGKNTTIDDIKESFKIIDGLMQKNKPGYSKRNSRTKNNFERDQEILNVPSDEFYTGVDILMENARKKGKEYNPGKREQKALANLRQIRKRNKN